MSDHFLKTKQACKVSCHSSLLPTLYIYLYHKCGDMSTIKRCHQRSQLSSVTGSAYVSGPVLQHRKLRVLSAFTRHCVGNRPWTILATSAAMGIMDEVL